MAVNNPFEITYGSRVVGGASDTYQLFGPYTFEKSFTNMRVAFTVVVVATTYATLQNLSDALETDFRKRDLTLKIDLDAVADRGGSSMWTFTHGTDILNTVANITKTGDRETDRGFSRSYICVVEGELPADDAATGLRDVQWNVLYEAGRQRIVTMRGTYTALSGTAAVAKYQNAAGADAEATTFLAALSGSATYELTDEQYDVDRNDHTCSFTRQYVELLANQTSASLDASNIRDHHVTFSILAVHPGDSMPDLYRLRRIAATYDCAVDIDNSTDLQSVYADEIKPYIKAEFQSDYSPQVFCIEDQRISYNETAKRISVSLQFLYQPSEASEFVEVTHSITTRVLRTLDATPVHNGRELAAYIDVGWATKERLITRTAIVVGTDEPSGRLGGGDSGEGSTAGESDDPRGIFRIPTGGGGEWHVVQSTAQLTPHWIGDPDDEQIQVNILNETVTMRFWETPRTGGASSGPKIVKVPIVGIPPR